MDQGSLSETTGVGMRWTEALLAFIALASLAVIYVERRAAGRIRAQLTATADERRVLSARVLRAETDARLYRTVATSSRLASGVTLEGETLDSTRVVVQLSSSDVPILLYSIDPNCAACLATLPFIQEVGREAVCGLRVIGIGVNALDNLDALRKDQGLAFPILRSAQGEAWRLFPIAASPATVLIGPRGRLHGWWLGTLGQEDRAEIRRLIAGSCSRGWR